MTQIRTAGRKIIGLDEFLGIMGSDGAYDNMIYEADATGVKVRSDCGAIFSQLSGDERKAVFPAKLGDYALQFPCTVEELEALASFDGQGIAGGINKDALQSVIERNTFDPTVLKPAAKRSAGAESWVGRARDIALDAIKGRPKNVTAATQKDVAKCVSDKLGEMKILGANGVSISADYVRKEALSKDGWWQENKCAR